MKTETGEYIVGAYLQHFCDCGFVQYNVRRPGGKREGQNEHDVVGLNLKNHKACLCEVATHIRGLNYGGGNADTVARVKEKMNAQKQYAADRLPGFEPRFMFWSPVVMPAVLEELRSMEGEGVELWVNGRYKDAVETIRKIAKNECHDMGNPFIRALQILEHLRSD